MLRETILRHFLEDSSDAPAGLSPSCSPQCPAQHLGLYWLFFHYFTSSPCLYFIAVPTPWWLILCVNLPGPQHIQMLNVISGCVCEVFWMRLIFESAVWVKQIVFHMWVGIIWSAEALSEMEARVRKKKKKNLSAWLSLSRYIGALPSLDLDSEWNLYHHTICTIYTSFPGFPTCCLQILGFSAFIITWAKSHSLTVNSYLSVYLSI